MLEGLLRIIRSFGKKGAVIRKDILLKYLDFTMRSITDEVIPAFDSILSAKDLKRIKNNKLFTEIYRQCDINVKDNYAALERMKLTFIQITEHKQEIENLINKHVNPVVTDKSVKAAEVAVIGLVKDIAAISSFILDLLYFITLIDPKKESDLPKIKFDSIRECIPAFIEIYKKYFTDFPKLIRNMSDISPEAINAADDLSLISIVLSKTGKTLDLPTTSGFIGNPIYHFRMYLVDREIEKYEALKAKKQLVELKVMELKLNEKEDSNADLTKQIEYWENKLADIEYKINKIEKDL